MNVMLCSFVVTNALYIVIKVFSLCYCLVVGSSKTIGLFSEKKKISLEVFLGFRVWLNMKLFLTNFMSQIFYYFGYWIPCYFEASLWSWSCWIYRGFDFPVFRLMLYWSTLFFVVLFWVGALMLCSVFSSFSSPRKWLDGVWLYLCYFCL